ncbi:MAG TPA: hypothetical protein VFZ61_07985, partial [Polyangiales bacterium]
GAGATALHLTQRFERATRLDGVVDRMRNAVASGPAYRVGPVKHPNFPFVMLDRALRYHDAVRNRAHALSAAGEAISPVREQGQLAERLPVQRREALASIFSKLQRRAERPSPALHAALYSEVRALISEASAKGA